MVDRLIRAVAERHWWAEWRFRRAGGRVACYGRVQLNLGAGARVRTMGRPIVGALSLGFGSLRTDTTVVAVGKEGELSLEDRVVIGRGSSLLVGPNAHLGIGAGSYVADGSRLAASTAVRIGSRCAISWGVTVLDDDGHGFGPPPYGAPVTVGDDVWVGCNVTILKGVTVGSGSVVGAGSVVTRSCPPRSLIAGVPAKVVRSGVVWTDTNRERAVGISE